MASVYVLHAVSKLIPPVDPPMGREAFPETRWSLVVAGGATPGGNSALEALARAYWRPVYGYVRARRARSEQDALDATQGFFLWILESGFLARADPQRGRFRGFVRTALDRFLTDRGRAQAAEKRGGGKNPMPLVDGDGKSIDLPDTRGQSPDLALDDLWRAELLERAATALREELESEGRGLHYTIFADAFLGDEELAYADLAKRHGVTRNDVSNWLSRVKKRYGDCLRRTVLETVGDADALAAELQWLFGGELP